MPDLKQVSFSALSICCNYTDEKLHEKTIRTDWLFWVSSGAD